MSGVSIVCPTCRGVAVKATGEVNRARRQTKPIYCGKACAGVARRTDKTIETKKEEKRLYDTAYRAKNRRMLKAKKAAWFRASYNPIKAAKARKERMPRHVEYCRQPEYRIWKKSYDRNYRATRQYGEFGEAFLVLMDIENEIAQRITRYEVYQQNGTLNKHQQRRRDYEKLIGN